MTLTSSSNPIPSATPADPADVPGSAIAALSVVVPVHNEAGNITPLIEEIHAALAGLPHEIIYVDDASRDESLRELAACTERFASLRVLRNERQAGQSTSVLNGVRAARHEWVATLDGDGQNDPKDIPHLIAALIEDGEAIMAIGHRRKRRDTWLRRRASGIAKGARRLVLGDEVPDSGCGLKVLRRDAYLALPYFDHMHRFLPTLVQQGGQRVLSVAVNHRPRERGRSKYGILDRAMAGVIDIVGVAWLGLRNRKTQTEELERRP
ncbi:MAG: glycosyltransferase family 2 protein [Pseudomonadota bacterium]